MSRPGVHLTTVAVERPYDLRGSFHRNPLRAAVRPRLACHSLAETQSRSAGKDSAEAAGSGRRATHGGRCVKRRDTDGGAASSASRRSKKDISRCTIIWKTVNVSSVFLFEGGSDVSLSRRNKKTFVNRRNLVTFVFGLTYRNSDLAEGTLQSIFREAKLK